VLTGHTFYADDGHLFLAASGVQYGASKGGTEHDVDTWHVTADSQFCNMWHMWRGRRERCFVVYREGETFALHAKDRLDKEVYRRVLGNPEGYRAVPPSAGSMRHAPVATARHLEGLAQHPAGEQTGEERLG
jgi:hypothetical protein